MDILELLEPITYENIHELKPGEWIWDNKITKRDEHRLSLHYENIEEPYGFRMIDILDIDNLVYGGRPFMLTCVLEGRYSSDRKWVYFETGRFYKFKKKRSEE